MISPRRLSTEPQTGRFCHGDEVELADICLAAQVTSNDRCAIDQTGYRTIARIAAECELLPAFRAALPAVQPNSE